MADIKWYFKGSFWFGLYLVLVFASLFVLLLGTVLTGRGFWWEFSAADILGRGHLVSSVA